MFMRHKGANSSQKRLPGSSPQGAFLGILLFIIIFNGAALRPSPRQYELNLKYIDDLSLLVALNLRKVLRKDENERERPLCFNERNQLILPSACNPLQPQLEELKKFTEKKLLKIKEKKTNIMKFNFSKHYDFPPELSIEGFTNQLDVIEETKLQMT